MKQPSKSTDSKHSAEKVEVYSGSLAGSSQSPTAQLLGQSPIFRSLLSLAWMVLLKAQT